MDEKGGQLARHGRRDVHHWSPERLRGLGAGGPTALSATQRRHRRHRRPVLAGAPNRPCPASPTQPDGSGAAVASAPARRRPSPARTTDWGCWGRWPSPKSSFPTALGNPRRTRGPASSPTEARQARCRRLPPARWRGGDVRNPPLRHELGRRLCPCALTRVGHASAEETSPRSPAPGRHRARTWSRRADVPGRRAPVGYPRRRFT